MLFGLVFRRSIGHFRLQFALQRTFNLPVKSFAVPGTRNFTHISSQSAHSLLKANHSRPADACIQKRFKKKKQQKPEQPEPSDDEEEDEEKDEDDADDQVVEVGYMDKEININANRFVAILKAGLNTNKQSIEQAFFDGRVRVNGYLLTKKSEMGSKGDVIDIIKGRNKENNDFLDISRVEILTLPDIGTNTGRIKMKVRIFRRLTVENYTEDPYEGQAVYIDDKNERKV